MAAGLYYYLLTHKMLMSEPQRHYYRGCVLADFSDGYFISFAGLFIVATIHLWSKRRKQALSIAAFAVIALVAAIGIFHLDYFLEHLN